MFDKKPADWFNRNLSDGGPIYMETSPGEFIIEPWNAFSSLLIIIPAVYWLIRMKKEGNLNTMAWIAIVLIMAGGLGSALFHAFRASVFFLIMDVLPTALLTITLSVFFWIKVLKKWWFALIIYIPLFSLRFLFVTLPEHTAINLSYFITGVSIGLPLLIYLYQTNFIKWESVVMTIISFSIALLFRQLDKLHIEVLPMGTHFLWHTFSAVGAFFMLDYLNYVLARKLVSAS